MKTLLRFRNLLYFVDLAFQVPRDIILDPLTIGIFSLFSEEEKKCPQMKDQSHNITSKTLLVVHDQFHARHSRPTGTQAAGQGRPGQQVTADWSGRQSQLHSKGYHFTHLIHDILTIEK